MIGRTDIITTNTELILRAVIEKAGRDSLADVYQIGELQARS